MKIVVNKRFGGFGLSKKACEMLGIDEGDDFIYNMRKRHDSELVRVVEELSEEANGDFASLKVVELPQDATDYYINEYDGMENILIAVNGKIKVFD